MSLIGNPALEALHFAVVAHFRVVIYRTYPRGGMMQEKLQSAFVRGLGLADGADFHTLQYAKTRGWDSIAHMQLVAVIEAEFDVRLETVDILALSSYDKAVEILAKYEALR